MIHHTAILFVHHGVGFYYNPLGAIPIKSQISLPAVATAVLQGFCMLMLFFLLLFGLRILLLTFLCV